MTSDVEGLRAYVEAQVRPLVDQQHARALVVTVDTARPLGEVVVAVGAPADAMRFLLGAQGRTADAIRRLARAWGRAKKINGRVDVRMHQL